MPNKASVVDLTELRSKPWDQCTAWGRDCAQDQGWPASRGLQGVLHKEGLLPDSWERLLYCSTTALWISLTFRQDPLHLNGDFSLYMQHFLLWTTANNHSILVIPPILYFWLIFASIGAEPPMSHIISSLTIVSSITSAHQRPQPDPVVPIISEIKWNVVEKWDNEYSKWGQGATWRQ